MSSGSEIVYLALGDSLGVGVGARDGRGYAARLYDRLRQIHPDARSRNLCVSGATSRGLIDRQLSRAVPDARGLATVLIGINDVIQGVAPATFGNNMELIARTLAERRTPALFCTLPDLAHAPAARIFLSREQAQRSLIEECMRMFNRQIVVHAEAHGHAVLDLFGVPLRQPEAFFSRDGFHPSEVGYELLAEQLWPAFRKLVEAASSSP